MSIWDNHDVGNGISQEACEALEPGTRLRHYVFGDGSVEYRGSKTTGTVMPGDGLGIRFDRHGLKELMPCFACGKIMILPSLDVTNP